MRMMSNRHHSGRHAAWACAFLLGTSSARAQTSGQEGARRRELIHRARVAHDAHRDAESLALLEQAAAIEMTPSLRCLIAENQSALRLVGPALDNARRCEQEFSTDASLPLRDEYLQRCHRLVEALSPPVESPVAAAPAEPPRVEAPAVAPTEGRVPMPPPTRSPFLLRSGAGPWVLAGAGVVGFIGAAAFWGLRESARGDMPCLASSGDCYTATTSAFAQAHSDQERAHDFNTALNVSLAVGGAALAAGVLWFALGTQTEARSPPPVALLVTPLSGGVVLGAAGSM